MRIRPFLLLCMLLCSLPEPVAGQAAATDADKDSKKTGKHESPVNFGIKGGFTSSSFLISDFSIEGVPIDVVQNNYRIGYFGSLFMRINFDKHFLQPEISYNVNRSSLTFQMPADEGEMLPGDRLSSMSISSSIHSIDIPVIYGYNFIKQGPYSLAIFGGPKIRCIMTGLSNTEFEGFEQTDIKEELHPFNVSLTMGVAVNISNIFFDFRYDAGLHNISKGVTYTDDSSAGNAIHFKRRNDVLSFSLGIFF